jgi:hypothetical protein
LYFRNLQGWLVIGIYTLFWLGMPLVAILNAVIREKVYKNTVGELAAHQLSTVTLIILIGIYTWLVSLGWKLESVAQALIVGVIWLVLTISFEFGFGRLVMKHTWERLFNDYNVLKGRIWILVLVWTLLAPLVINSIYF